MANTTNTTVGRYSDLTTYTETICQEWAGICGATFVVAEKLEEAFVKLKDNKDKKLWNNWVEDELPFTQSTAQKLRKIFQKEILFDVEVRPVLPSEWSKIYQISLMKDDDIRKAVANKTINPAMDTNDIKELRGVEAPEFILSKCAADWSLDRVKRYRKALVERLDAADKLIQEKNPIAA